MVVSLFLLLLNMFATKSLRFHISVRGLHKSTGLYLNRILVELEECIEENGTLQVQLDNKDSRAKHINSVLQLDKGDSLRMGVLDVGRSDHSLLKQKDDKGMVLDIGRPSDLQRDERPRVDLLLAVPRPLRLERLLPVISSMGVGRIILVDAKKVEKAFFGSHLFRRSDQLREGLVEGLSQGGTDCCVPEIIVRRNLPRFLSQELDALCPRDHIRRVVAHPLRADAHTDTDTQKLSPAGSVPTSLGTLENESRRGRTLHHATSLSISRFSSIPPLPRLSLSLSSGEHVSPRVLVAVGPEGGWDDQELALMSQLGFLGVHMGSRALRTDTAVTALLALAQEWIATQDSLISDTKN
mmetsp:Transcript_376/g.375  ORF Transcript_376/g.375 Transcript_376/m.375 type:complete len:354 (-) Transcript_376:31-1092(-)